LFDVYAAEYWQLLCPEVEKFSDLLTAIGDHVENELACHELTTSIRDAISEKTFCWMQRSAREIFQVRPEPQPVPATHSAPDQGEAKQTYKTPLARNIDNLRKECGWSLDDLSKTTGHDKKLILGHLQGKGAYPSTLKAYADAFSEKLGRPVLVADLDPATD
jgi:hypothetical protein